MAELRGRLLSDDVRVTVTRDYGQTASEKSDELLFHILIATAGVVLLVAMVGAIVLTLRHKAGVKRQNISAQNARTRETAIDVVKVQPGQGL